MSKFEVEKKDKKCLLKIKYILHSKQSYALTINVITN